MKYIARSRVTITAWKYEQNVGVPVWVARRCHDLNDGKFTANTVIGPVPIELGDYVVLLDAQENTITVVSGVEFEKEYMPLGDSQRRVATFDAYAVFSPYESHDGGVGWTVQGRTVDPEDFDDLIAEFSEEADARLFAEAKAAQ